MAFVVRIETDNAAFDGRGAREVEVAERKARYDAMREQIRAKTPAGWRDGGTLALITAEWKEDNSDLQSDYVDSRTALTVAIGWRFGKREDFKQLRAAAETFLNSGRTFEAQCVGRHYGSGTCNHNQNAAHAYTITAEPAAIAKLTRAPR